MINKNICVVGLGYVGLPLAVEFSKKYKTLGFDIDENRVESILQCNDYTLEVENHELKDVIINKNSYLKKKAKGLFCSSNINDIKDCNFYIVTVPTPTDKNKRPILTPLINASNTVAKFLNKGDYVIYESTVYPGVTEDECVPVLERISNLKLNKDFFVGYSPERINPGDKNRKLTNILKVTSGSNQKSAKVIDELYKSIIAAGTHLASSIKIAEASKVIENSQRDINIAFVNELAKIFSNMNIDTHSVLEAAGTKWNFLPFKPGLVGGHCIGVDPYYLAQKAQETGYYPEIILAGRRINDSMGSFVASEIVKKMVKNEIPLNKSKILLLGFTFKENCPDHRNTRVIDIYHDLKEYGLDITLYDPWLKKDEIMHEYKISISNSKSEILSKKYSAIILAVSHSEFLTLDYNSLKSEKSIIYDLKAFLPKDIIDYRL